MKKEIQCQYCKKIIIKEISKKKYRKDPIFCSRSCQLRGVNFEWERADRESKEAKYIQNFYKNIIIRNGCWGCKKYKKKNGYINIEIGKRKTELLHRLSYKLHYGEIPKGKQVNHKCNNPSCSRPSHLYLGTQKENIQDQHIRGSHSHGEKHGMSKLKENQVKTIKKMLKNKLKHKDIAMKFNISRSAVTDINNKKTWGHIE
jgi:hypothetical protein